MMTEGFTLRQLHLPARARKARNNRATTGSSTCGLAAELIYDWLVVAAVRHYSIWVGRGAGHRRGIIMIAGRAGARTLPGAVRAVEYVSAPGTRRGAVARRRRRWRGRRRHDGGAACWKTETAISWPPRWSRITAGTAGAS